MPEAGVVFGGYRREAADFFVGCDARLPPGSFFLDERAWYVRVGGCGRKFAGILFRGVAERPADLDGVASGHGPECRSLRRDFGSGAGSRAGGIFERIEAAIWDRGHWLVVSIGSEVRSSIHRKPSSGGPSG